MTYLPIFLVLNTQNMDGDTDHPLTLVISSTNFYTLDTVPTDRTYEGLPSWNLFRTLWRLDNQKKKYFTPVIITVKLFLQPS